MRRYIRKEDLQNTLQSILNKQDQELLKVYKEVVMYRVTGNSDKYFHAAASLAIPRKIGISLVNITLIPAFAAAMQVLMPAAFHIQFGLPVFAFLLLFSYFQFKALYTAIRGLQHYKPYLIVDELIVRKIIMIQKKTGKKTA